MLKRVLVFFIFGGVVACSNQSRQNKKDVVNDIGVNQQNIEGEEDSKVQGQDTVIDSVRDNEEIDSVNQDAGKEDVGACIPKKCSDLGWECGSGDDGCGGKLDCGKCSLCHEHRFDG